MVRVVKFRQAKLFLISEIHISILKVCEKGILWDFIPYTSAMLATKKCMICM
jgi:hypothetical protein